VLLRTLCEGKRAHKPLFRARGKLRKFFTSEAIQTPLFPSGNIRFPKECTSLQKDSRKWLANKKSSFNTKKKASNIVDFFGD